jgi:hypothetical protein
MNEHISPCHKKTPHPRHSDGWSPKYGKCVCPGVTGRLKSGNLFNYRARTVDDEEIDVTALLRRVR